MARSIGKLAAQLVATDDGFVKVLDRVEKALESTERKARKTGKGLNDAFSFGAAAGATIVAIEGLSNRVQAVFTRISKSIEDLNRSAENASMLGLGTVEIQEIEGAFKLANIEAETTRRLVDDLVRTVADARIGDDSAIAQLARIGLSAEELRGLGTRELLDQIADGLAGIENPAERSAAAFDLFGKQGHNALRVLSEGSSGLASAIAEVRAVGGVVSDVDVQRAVLVDQATDRLSVAFDGLAKRASVVLAPALEKVLNQMTDILSKLEGGDLIRVIDKLGDAWNFARGAGNAVVGEIGTAVVAVTQGLDAANQFNADMRQETQRLMNGETAGGQSDFDARAQAAAKASEDALNRGRRIARLRFADEMEVVKVAEQVVAVEEERVDIARELYRISLENLEAMRGIDVDSSLAALAGIEPTRRGGLADLVLGDSAEAQRLAFNAGNLGEDKALQAQQKTAKNTEEIKNNTRNSANKFNMFLP
jgi:hypothetical protein